MGELVSVSPSEISRIRAGARRWTAAQLEKIAQHYRIPLSLLLLDAVRDLHNYQLNAELRYYLEKAIEQLDRVGVAPILAGKSDAA